MCGRYALGIRATFVRYQLQQQGMQVDNAPDDDAARETYNFPPGSYGLVYRADVPDNGLRDDGDEPTQHSDDQPADAQNGTETQVEQTSTNDAATNTNSTKDVATKNDHQSSKSQKFNYELKVMKWGLIPFWTKRSPDYGSMMRTINCRDDSLIENRGMWTTMKQRKRCIVIAQGFYEWLKKGPAGSKQEKIPHFVKRKDGQLMCFAGLWDCVKYEDSEAGEKLYTYTIITTDSNSQLKFLHDRMPVILDPNTDAMKLWLDPTITKWNKDMQSILKPFEGELECYPVNKEVGKVGNNSPDFIIPIDSKENKKNIANFFGNARRIEKESKTIKKEEKEAGQVKIEDQDQAEKEENRETKDHDSSENHAPLPVPPKSEGGVKRKAEIEDEGQVDHDHNSHMEKQPKLEFSPENKVKGTRSNGGSPDKMSQTSNISTPVKATNTRKTRSATSNEGISKKPSPVKTDGTQRITSFFGSKDAG